MTAGLVVGANGESGRGADRAAPQCPRPARHRRRAGRDLNCSRRVGAWSEREGDAGTICARDEARRVARSSASWPGTTRSPGSSTGSASSIVSVGDTVGMNLWGHATPFEVTLDQMVTVCQAVRRGVSRALVSGDFPYGPLQEGPDSAVRAGDPAGQGGRRRPGQAGRRGRPPGRGARGRPGRHPGVRPARGHPAGGAAARARLRGDGRGRARRCRTSMAERLVAEAKALEDAGAALLDFTNSGPVVGAAVARSVSIPVLGGFGGGPWLDGRVRMAHAAIGYAAAGLDDPPDTYADVAQDQLRRAVARTRPTCGRATRSAAASRCRPERPSTCPRRRRRHPHPLRGVRGRAAAADVLTRRVRLDAGELDPARHLPADRADGPAARAVHLHRVRPARVGPVRRPAGADPLGPTGSPRAPACSTTSASSGRT